MVVPEFESRTNEPGIRVGVAQNAELEVMPAYRGKMSCAFPRPSAGRKTGGK